MKVVTSARIRGGLEEKLEQNHPDIQFHFHKKMSEARQDLLDADILVTYGEDLTDEIIAEAKNLKWIMVISAGLDRMPLKAIKDKGIILTNARGIHKIPMAEYTFAGILQWAKKTKQWTENQKAHLWDKNGIRKSELAGKTLTVIGAGAIGEEVARLAQAFRMKTLGVNRSGHPVEFFDEIYTMDEIETPLSESQVVVSILPHTMETDKLLGKKHFDVMLDDSLFINIGRGKTVDQPALLEALQTRNLSAVLDVFDPEPLPENHPFWDMENVTITSHFSAITSQYQPRAIEIFNQNLSRFKSEDKNLINFIDPERGY